MSWTTLARDVTVAGYGLFTLSLAAVGLYYGLLALERLVRTADVERAGAELRPPADRPSVTVQIPVYDERHVVDRLLQAVGDLDWPASKLQVQVIDDSTDETTAVVREELASLSEQGIAVEHVERDERAGYKAGAVQAGLQSATGEFVALFDADFVPPSDFLEETIHHFRDPQVGCVQTRWTHLNESYSWFTRAQALALDAHFAVEQWVRAQVGSLMSFNATSCVWRRETIDDVGGWSSETVAEDLDLTARALLNEWQFVYTEGYAVPCEIPVSLAGFVRQQTRWARGSAQNVRKHLVGILRARSLSPWAKFHSLLHVLHYVFYPLLLVWIALHVVVTAFADVPSWVLVAGFLGTTPGPLAFLVLGQVVVDRPGSLKRLPAALPLTMAGIGIAWRMAAAVTSGFAAMGGSFARTPKFRIEGSRRSWRGLAYDHGLGNTVPETLLGSWCALGVTTAITVGAFRMGPSMVFFALSFWTVAGVASRQR